MPYVIEESHLAHDPAGKIIAYATKSDVQHSAVVTLDEDGKKRWRYEALVGEGYVKKPWSQRVDVVERKVWATPERYEMATWWADRSVGTKYPPIAYLGLEYVIPGLRHYRRTLYCSQAALKWLELLGYYDLDESLIRPSPGACDAAWLAAEKACETLAKRDVNGRIVG